MSRIASYGVTDSIPLMAGGRVVESGSHSELLARGGRYVVGIAGRSLRRTMLDRRGDPGRPFYLGRGHVNAMLAENICVTTGAQEN